MKQIIEKVGAGLLVAMMVIWAIGVWVFQFAAGLVGLYLAFFILHKIFS